MMDIRYMDPMEIEGLIVLDGVLMSSIDEEEGQKEKSQTEERTFTAWPDKKK